MSVRERIVALTATTTLFLTGCAASSATPSRESEPAIEAVAVLSPEARQVRERLMNDLWQRSPIDVQEQLALTGTAPILKGKCVGWYIEDQRYAITVAPAFLTYQTGEGSLSSFVSTHAPVRRQTVEELSMLLGPFSYQITADNAPGSGNTYKNFPYDILSFDLEPEGPLHPTWTGIQLSSRSNGSFLTDNEGNLVMATTIFSRDDPRSFRELCDAARALPAGA